MIAEVSLGSWVAGWLGGWVAGWLGSWTSSSWESGVRVKEIPPCSSVRCCNLGRCDLTFLFSAIPHRLMVIAPTRVRCVAPTTTAGSHQPASVQSHRPGPVQLISPRSARFPASRSCSGSSLRGRRIRRGSNSGLASAESVRSTTGSTSGDRQRWLRSGWCSRRSA